MGQQDGTRQDSAGLPWIGVRDPSPLTEQGAVVVLILLGAYLIIEQAVR
jgi:hypothetical protein